MTRKIVLVESDASLVQQLRPLLESRGCEVLDIADGKAAVERVRRERPDLIVLAVELAQGQSGYIVCGKLKKDEALRGIPVILTGRDADGFEAHKRLKARADDYLKKPFEPEELCARIDALLGPGEAEQEEILLSEEDAIAVETLAPAGEQGAPGDPDLALLDAAFENISEDAPLPLAMTEGDDGLVEPLADPGFAPTPPPGNLDSPLLGPDLPDSEADRTAAVQLELEEDRALDALGAPAEPPPERAAIPPAPPSRARLSSAVNSEVLELRRRVDELEASRRELEDVLASRTSELEALRVRLDLRDKDLAALREQLSLRERELVRGRQDLAEQQQQAAELRQRQRELEERHAELLADLARKDTQLKMLSQRCEGLLADRKRLEGALAQAKDEARELSQALAAAQGELDQAQEGALEAHRDLEEARTELERTRAGAASPDLVEENRALRARIAELERLNAKSEERMVKAYQKINAEERQRARARQALRTAVEALEATLSEDGLSDNPEADTF